MGMLRDRGWTTPEVVYEWLDREYAFNTDRIVWLSKETARGSRTSRQGSLPAEAGSEGPGPHVAGEAGPPLPDVSYIGQATMSLTRETPRR